MKLLTILFVLSLVMLTIPISINAQPDASPATLRRLADDYYNWRNQTYPVSSSDAGLHTWDSKLTDYGLSALLARRLHVKEVLAKVNAMQTEKWSKDDRIDWLLFRAQLEGVAFFDRVMDFEADRSANLCQRMQQRHLFLTEERL